MRPMGHRLLLVDDDPEVAWGVGRYLTRAGMAVVTASDGADALEILQEREFDALVTDVQMPQLNGLALVDWAHRHRPGMKVIVITGYGSPSVHQAALRRGAILYMEKPVDPALILEVLQDSERSDSFTGVVDQIDLFDYVQLMLVTRRQVVVEVTCAVSGRTVLYIRRGRIVHAACTECEGEGAVFRCLEAEGGAFRTLPWEEPPRESITVEGEHLLLEAARRKDEAIRECAEAVRKARRGGRA